MKRIWLFILAGLLLLTGLGILLYPNLNRLAAGFTDQEKIVHFREEQKETDGEDAPYADLLTQMQDYNKEIYENGQEDLKDVWSYEQNPFDFDTAGLADDMIGYITIDAMDEEMPLYIGANEENMSKGAVVMGQTSMPIGGENTNCVIAAHRGYRGIPMFQYIEVLQPGDKIEITNLWDTIEYEVAKCIVIRPDDIDAVKIVPGQDMLTLITCHPYTQNYQRYVVYCRRTDHGEGAAQPDGENDPLAAFDGVVYVSSADDIRREQLVNTAVMAGCAALCLFILKAVCVRAVGGRKRRKRKMHAKRERRKGRRNG
ncbi:MAG TPA: class C sortase [Candidatus Mediterraneibacter faecavium]|uniref:Class C sortase n=1 Tax=Candidatus Mediterraneibacter faecavium TaxID=2838668 RepID=A0A9D2QAR0_9FIRM|nr:class C sortase [Candidatus Mediterraneibacter faecavium]